MVENIGHPCVGLKWERKACYDPIWYNKPQKKIKFIRERLPATQNRQKSYSDHRRRPLEFKEGDHVFLRVTPTTGIGRVLKSKKLNPKFIGLIQILKRVRPAVYQITLPLNLSNVDNVFHISQLKNYCFDSSHIIESETIQIRDDLTYKTKSVQIIGRSIRNLIGNKIPLVKVVWKGLSHEEAIWKLEDKIKKSYLELYQIGQ